MTRPPRLAAWLLARRLWADERDVILGDLEEEFHRRSAVVGLRRARAGYWRDSLRLSWSLRSSTRQAPPSRRRLLMISDDIRFAFRRLRKRSASTAASVVTLAAAIGAAATTWSLLSATLLRPFPVAEPDELVVIGLSNPDRDGRADPPRWEHTYRFYSVVRGSGAFERLAIGGEESVMVATDGYLEARTVFFASHDYFDTLGVRPELGREFGEADDTREAPLVAVLSHRFWRTTFGADPRVLGREIRVEDRTAIVVGVAPRRFRGLNLTVAPDLYLPLHTVGQISPESNPFAEPLDKLRKMSSPTSWLTFVGRIPAEGSQARAADQLRARMPEMAARSVDPVFMNVVTAAVSTSAREAMVQFTRLVAITVGLLLLIGCLSVGMLVLLGTESRRDEIAMCRALGASKLRLARGVVLEGALLSVGGALLAPFVALLLFGGLSQFQLPGRLDVDLLELSIDGEVLFAAASGAMVATLLIAVFAGAFGVTADLADVLRSRAGATPRTARRRTRMILVGAQVAIAFVLLAGAGLFARSLAAALELNPGLPTNRLVRGFLPLNEHGYTSVRAGTFFGELRTRLEQHPTVESIAYEIPAGGMTPSGDLYVNDVPRRFPSLVSYVYVDDRYFSTIGQRVVQGRDFSPADYAQSPPVTVVSASLARLLVPDGQALGMTVRQSGDRVEVVGVVPDVITIVTMLEPLVIYRPIAQLNPDVPLAARRRMLLRAAGDPSPVIRDAIHTLKQMDPAITAPAFSTIDEQLTNQLAPQQFGAAVMGALGALAAILTLLGTYVLAASMAVTRRREMGIRAALGATRRQLGSSVLRESAALVGLGLTSGLGLAWLGAGTIRSFLFQVQPLDLATLATVAVMILVLAVAVSVRPAIVATRVDLATLLKDT
jgi:putative ABC transport system permease protein